ncbi:MAG TPA: YIP1 family protein [Terriglobia bacterium]|nr:YIP1 family protein [Terriglobia bacterium]
MGYMDPQSREDLARSIVRGEGETAPGEMPEPKGFGARFAGIFMSPGETFADVVRKPDFIAPLLVLIVGSIAFTETMLRKIGMYRIVQMSLEQSGQASKMSPDQMQQALSNGAKLGTIFGRVGEILGPPIILLIVAALGLLFVNAFFGGKMSFKTSFAVACYGDLVALLGYLIGMAMILFGDIEHFNPQAPTPTNLGFFVNPLETSKVVVALASSIDIFYFWPMALWAIGYAAASDRKAKPLSVFLCFFGIWAVILLIRMGFASLG